MVDLQARVMELEQQVSRLSEDKERLYKDLESLLMQSSSSTFWSGSSVLYDRISLAETELKESQKQNAELEAQLKNSKEDVAHLRAMKRAADGISKQELDRSLVLERDLVFYKQRGSQWLEEKNLIFYELEGLKKANVDLEVSLNESRAKCEVEMGLRDETEQKFQESQRKVNLLETRLTECARIPELERKLINSKEHAEKLTREMEELEGELDKKQEEIDEMHDKLEKTNAAFEEVEANLKLVSESTGSETRTLKAKISELEAELMSLNSNLHSQSVDLERADEAIASAKAQADFAVDDKERELKETKEMYEREIAELNAKLMDSESKLAHQMSLLRLATDAKLEALVQLSDAQSALSELESRSGHGTPNTNVNGSAAMANGSEQSTGRNRRRGQHALHS